MVALAVAASLMTAGDVSAANSAYKTSEGHVVVTGLPAGQRYQIRTLNAQNKSGTRQDKSANNCGEVVVEKATNYLTLVVGTMSFEPAKLETRAYTKCQPKPSGAKMQPSGVELAKPPAPK